MKDRRSRTGLAAGFALIALAGCTPAEPNALDKLGTADLTINGKKFQAWIADESSETENGLMFVTAEQMAALPDGTERGMLFVFDRDRPRTDGFWMRNVPIPLDIAFIRSNRTIVTILTMAPFDESTYRPEGTYRYALEVNANLFSRLGIVSGDTVQIPESVLKTP